MAGSKGMRNAGIRIEIQGERELNAQIKRMQQEFKNLTREIELTQATFAGQRNSLEALEAEYAKTQKAIAKLSDIHDKLVQKGIVIRNSLERETTERDKLHDKLVQEQKVLTDIINTYGKSSAEYEEQAKKVQEAQIAYDKQSAKVEDLTRKQARNTEAIIQNEIATGKLQAEEKFLGKAVDDANKSVDKQSTLLDENGKKLDATDKAIEGMAFATKALAAMEGLQVFTQQFSKLKEMVDECIKSYMEFETTVVSVTRTVNDLSNKEAGEFLQELSREIPLSVEELGRIASQGGQYGITKEDLKEYTRIIGALVTSTNLDYADSDLVAQLQGIMQTNIADYERFGSVLVDLGNKTRTTEKNIVNLAMRIAQEGKYIGLSEAEILGLADAIAATGGQAEGAGTAMNRFMEDLHKAILNGGKDLDAFANVAGVSTNEFKALFEEDAMGAITLVLKGLDNIAESGGNIYDAFESIGATNVREVQNLRNLSALWEDVVRSVEIANGAWEENVALAEESEKAWGTTASNVEKYESAVSNAKALLGSKWETGVGTIRGILTDIINFWTETNGMTFDLSYLFMANDPSKVAPGAAKGAWSKWNSGYTARERADEEKESLRHWQRMDDIYKSGAESLVSQYENAYRAIHEQTEAIREMYESTFDPMEKFSEKGQLTAKEFAKNLQSNAEKMQKYSDNLVKVLEDPRISDAVKEYIKGLDPSEAYKLVQDFANDKDGKLIKSANEGMAKFNQAISDSSLATGQATGDVTDQVVQSLEDADLAKVARDTGIDAMDGLIKGMASRERAVYAAAKSAATAVSMALNKTLQINSPSKVTEKSGESVGEGLVLGMQNMEKDVSEEAARLAILSANVYDGAIVGLQNGFNASFNVKTKDYTGILKQMNSKLGRNKTVVIEKPGRSSQSAVNDLERALVRGMLY